MLLWAVIEYGNSFSQSRTTTNQMYLYFNYRQTHYTEEKAHKKNDVKARSMLPMALPNEHQLTLNQYKDAKTLFEAIQARFGGNEATKKTQKTLFEADLLPPAKFKFTNVAFVSTPGSTNEDNTANVHDSTASTHVSTASTNNNTASLSDATVYAFLVNQPNGSQVVHEDLEQIHEDDLEEMDLKWQLALLIWKKARKIIMRTKKKIIINGSDTASYEKSKVECFNCHKMGHFARECIECFNCHKMGHFARECKGPRNQESMVRNQDISRRTVNVEDISSKEMVAIDGAGFDWSYMTDEEVPTNLVLMAFSDSEVHNTCSNTCLKSFETLKTQLDILRVEFNKSEFNLATYKIGLASVEEQLIFYKKNEVMLCDQIAVLKRDATFKDSEINALNILIEKLKKEKESNHIKIDNFENASKSLDKLIGSQISDNNRKGVGYNVIPPPPTGLFAPPTIDLSNSGLKEFQQSEFEGYEFKANKGVSVLTKSGIVPVSAARPINTVAPKSFVNAAKTRPNAFQKSHSSSRRPFYQQTSLKNRNLNDKVNTAKVNYVNTTKGNIVTSAVGEQEINVVKSSAC
ncbi:ribonuclease H-like domain-containing protein [Tanacetum coccineum]